MYAGDEHSGSKPMPIELSSGTFWETPRAMEEMI